MYLLSKELYFPNPTDTLEDGLLAIGGDLSVPRLLLAYKNGIFPWYNEQYPIMWYCPTQRLILFPQKVTIYKSMRKLIKSNRYNITVNKVFTQVVQQCKTIYRAHDHGETWITDNMVKAYTELHNQGHATSIEVWKNNELVGGLYGVDLGTVFCGESMFSKESNTSKLALIYLSQYLEEKKYAFIDCQMYTPHLASMGAETMSRKEFLKLLQDSLP